MNNNTTPKAIGQRLAIALAKKPNGRKEALEAANISSYTLNRYLSGKTPKIPLIPMAMICNKLEINIGWLVFGGNREQKKPTTKKKIK